MKIAITGANGYVGQNLCRHLRNPDNTILSITRSPFALEGCQNLVAPDLDSDVLTPRIEEFDCLIHLASHTHHTDAGTDQLELYRKVNVELAMKVASAAIKAKVKRFIYLSSIKVNGEESTRPLRWDDPPAPVDAYGISKHEAEMSLTKLLANSPVELVIIRPPLIWGGPPKGNLETLVKLIDKGVPLPFKNINNRRDIVSISNLCSLIESTITHPCAPGQTFLVSDGFPRSTEQIIKLMEKHTSRKARLFAVPSVFFWLLQRLPMTKNKMRKLGGNLEVDITDTKMILEWQPDSSQ